MRLNPESLTRSSSRHPWRVVVVWVLAVAGMGFASQTYLSDWLTSDVDFTNNPESKQAMQLIERNITGEQKDTEFYVIRNRVLAISDPTFEQYVRGVQGELMGLGEEVVAGNVTSVYDVLETAGLRTMRTTDPPGVLISIQLRAPVDPETRATMEEAIAQAIPPEEASAFDIRVLIPQELVASETLYPYALRVNPPELVVFLSSSTVAVDDPDPVGGLSFRSASEAIRGAVAAVVGPSLAAPPITYFDIAGMVSTDGRATLVAVPIMVLSFYMQKYIVRGMTYGAIRE